MSATDEAIRAADARLREAAASRTACAPVRELIGAEDQDAAYAVQSLGIERRIAEGRRLVGRKIGLTSPAVQAQFGVHSPDYGVLLDDMVVADREPMPLDRFLQPRVEAEVAFVLGRDLDSPTTHVADVLRATEFVLPAIEVVDSRIADWSIRIADTIADNASSGAVVLGTVPRKLDGLDLAAAGMRLDVDGDPVSTGAGSACLGSPVIAVAWLARAVARHGRPLRAGEIVLSGALGPMVAATPGVFHARLDGLGEVRADFLAPLDETEAAA
ncbi:2-keto-4-pentenoate hydratase [Agromyces mediolanus]|uniref:2-keto-4-pentenoate hydratase n=1 Tax=Agromyces mediolanus TaxID=41986 RepID=A0A918FDB6_AGRME|nr:fumarylacetoacetate hydrolase family protein [Agromyces mediolanus]GGR29353.1 2-keto-4-pentenoate hydratase [Agromyces mediolanus]GLJ72203.1 2-keto-4-pentenoate hydratase [Agromyces mediolanus]